MKLHNLDRRWIFLFILVGVAIPLIVPLGFKLEISPNVKMVYDLVESVPAGERVLLSFDYDPASKPELQPAAMAMIKHCIEKDLKIVLVALWPMGVSLADEIYQSQKDKLEWGVNFINLGYKAGGQITIQAMGKDFREIFSTDANGVSIDRFEIMDGVHTLKDFSFVASFSAGTPGMKEWIMVAKTNYDVAVTGGATAVSTPGFLPYINDQKQLNGLIGGLKSAAEYELLIDSPGTAARGMDAQSIAHLIIIAFIIIGNVSWYLSKKKEKTL